MHIDKFVLSVVNKKNVNKKKVVLATQDDRGFSIFVLKATIYLQKVHNFPWIYQITNDRMINRHHYIQRNVGVINVVSLINEEVENRNVYGIDCGR